ncbi:MAG: hypothetical protein ACLR76_03055 [Alistipes sp.]
MPANRWRTVFREYPEGLDLSDTPFVSFAVNTEAEPRADYYVRLTVGRGGRKFNMAKVTPKEWNVTIFDLSECPFADRIDRVEFALCNASDSVWENALYQLDGFEAGKPIDLSFGLKGSTEPFTAERGSVSHGDGTLEFAFDEGGSLRTPSLAGSRNGIYNPRLEDRNTMFFVMENRSRPTGSAFASSQRKTLSTMTKNRKFSTSTRTRPRKDASSTSPICRS